MRVIRGDAMKDLTQGSITRALVAMAVPIAVGMLFQTLYLLVDLYFVARLGDAAIAGVSSAGTAGFVILALTQMLGVGTVALVSHAVGRKDLAEANLVFNQSVLLSAICGVLTLVAGFVAGGAYVRSIAADPDVVAAGTAYLYWYTPGLALQFALVAMGSALRGTGIVRPTMMVQMLTRDSRLELAANHYVEELSGEIKPVDSSEALFKRFVNFVNAAASRVRQPSSSRSASRRAAGEP